ncbi:ABC transporter substrate-binding protein [Oscillospiraceae bacterium MB08-C2-2]|nr:ABC transporter substrate-binding protein [Oscillospiraceae bacterium MB08-C2-2]
MKKTRIIAFVMAMALVAFTGCSTTPPAAPSSTSPAPENSKPAEASSAPATSKEFDGTVTFGVVAPVTGTNKMVGEYVVNGAKLAVEDINAAGGILGKELKIVVEDEVDNLQASVNAMVKIMNYPEVVAFFGSTYSGNCIAASPNVLEKKIPMFAGGSSANIPKENNPYIWQVRMTDDQSGVLLAKAATESLKMKNPAILYSTESFGTGLKDQTLAALKDIGIDVSENNQYGFVVDEKNFTPMITQIQNSDVDGLIAIGHQMPAAVICQQVDAAGLDIPLLGSSSWASAVCRENAGSTSDGWYAVADWTVEVATEEGRKFGTNYKTVYNAYSDMPAVTTYDSMMLFKEACEIAGTTTDKEAINNALKEIKDYKGAMSTYTYADNHCFSTSQFLTHNEEGRAVMIDTVKTR